MRKILMLDIDGVLNIESKSYTTSIHQENLCERHLVQRLNYLCQKVEDLEIVISSSWRKDMNETQEVLEESGFKYWDRVVGRTSISSHSGTLKRGEQIYQWLKENISETFLSGIDAQLFILDDKEYGTEEFWDKEFYFIDKEIGLTDKTVQKILGAIR